MLIFDQLKNDDPQLRFLAVLVACGMAILLAGLWWVQVVSSNRYQDALENQSTRTVRTPAVRGNILDRDGRVLAENRPSYSIDLYLEDLSRNFQIAYTNSLGRLKRNLAMQKAAAMKNVGHALSKQEQKQLDRQFAVTEKMKTELQQQTRYEVSSNIVAELGARLQQNVALEQKDFQRQYEKARIVPLPVILNLDSRLVARFEEQSMHTPGMDLDVQPVRSYPNGTVAAHLLGYVSHNQDSPDDEPLPPNSPARRSRQSDYDYRMDDYTGLTGIEKIMDKDLRGNAGGKSVLVNNLGYRQSETVWAPVEPGHDVVLTIDLDIQKAAEIALQEQQASVRGAVIVMNATNGDVLAMASSPTYDPNFFAVRHDAATWAQEQQYLGDEVMRPEWNRAMQENYAPGSVFKIVTGLATLEQGTNPEEQYHSPGFYKIPGRNRPIGDTAGEGWFNFSRALAKSSNPYFITQGLKPGVLPRIIAIGQRLHFGERTGMLSPPLETRGHFPTSRNITSSAWHDGDTANLSIGQGPIEVTPLQVAVMVSAVANGGTVFYPRIVSQVNAYESSVVCESFPAGHVRDTLSNVSQRSLRVVREAMRADVESAEGTGHATFIPGFSIAGKTGTAEVENRPGHIEIGLQDTWFVSFAPYENPRYVVVATVEGGRSGSKTCVPIVHKVYEAILQREQQRQQRPARKLGTLAEAP